MSFSPVVVLVVVFLVSEVLLAVSFSVEAGLIGGGLVIVLEEDCVVSEVLPLAIRCPLAVVGEESVVGGGWKSVAEAYLTGTSIIMRGRRKDDLVPLLNGFMITKMAKNMESKENTSVLMKDFKRTRGFVFILIWFRREDSTQ